MTTLAVGPAQTRGFVLSAFASFDISDLADTVGSTLFTLPLGATIVGGRLSVTTAFDGGTGVAIICGDATDPNRYLAGGDAKTATDDELIGTTGYSIVAADRAITVTYTDGGTASTVGAGEVLAVYADPSYNTINQE